MPSAVPQADPWIGRTIHDRYVVVRAVARGSMGSVYVARHTALDREVAIKILDVHAGRHVTDSQSDARDRKRFLREASMLAKLTHPNTVRVFDFGIENETPFIVMEYVKGQTLQDILVATPVMPPERALRITRQVCSSLGEAHDLGLVHRDLKPANILVTTDFDGSDMVKVVDFGLVKEVRDAVQMTGDGILIGTPMYMSPEQIRGRSLDQRCDIYALGVVLYKMLLGRPPFVEPQTAALLVAHITDPVPSFVEVNPSVSFPASIEYTVRRCLEKEPSDRFETSRDLLRALKVCEAAILDIGLASSAQRDLIEGKGSLPPELFSSTEIFDHRLVANAKRKRVVRRIQWVVGASIAMVFALSFGYVSVVAVMAVTAPQDVITQPAPVAVPAVPKPVSPVPVPAPVELPDPPEDVPSAEPERAPEPRPEPRPTRIRPAPRPVAPSPEPPAPAPVPEAQPPRPQPQGSDSDLTDPWSTNGDAP
jgi:eukaryotic-like serine/threonine-protein kinase